MDKNDRVLHNMIKTAIFLEAGAGKPAISKEIVYLKGNDFCNSLHKNMRLVAFFKDLIKDFVIHWDQIF